MLHFLLDGNVAKVPIYDDLKGEYINADVNGSYQICKKVFPNAYANGIEGVALHPTVVNILL